MGVKQLKIDVNEVTIGMFVSGLDRPWTQTPFPLQGFYVRDLEEIKELKAHCHHVYIDVIKGAGPLREKLKQLSGQGERKESRLSLGSKAGDNSPIRVKRDVYTSSVMPVTQEISRARSLHREVYHAVSNVMTQMEAGHHKIPLQETKRAAGAMVDSILRSPDAFTWLSRVREKDEHTYSHAVRSAVWGILFGRHIGLSKTDLDVLALGILLKDIGKTRLPRHILEKAQLSEPERKAFEKFVDYGVDILRKMPDIKPRVTSVVKTHCERINGSGFPDHLRGDRIPLLGKIAGIVTFYDETTNPRGQSHPMSPSKAVAKLYELRDVQFQSDLVVEFIRAIGLYPTGTLVELNTGEVAVVVEQNFKRRLKPKVLVVMDAYKRRLESPVLLDMAEDEKEKQSRIDTGKVHPRDADFTEIVQDLEPGAFDVDINAVRDHYMQRSANKTLFSFLKSRSKLPSIFSGN